MATEFAFSRLQDIRQSLLQHPIYEKLHKPEHIRIFMKHHVFAVWDFMSLLKRLQMELTCVTLPWLPSHAAPYARFINEIVLGEESDQDPQGSYTSHFDLYLKAMKEVGADTTWIDQFLKCMKEGKTVAQALNETQVPSSISSFVMKNIQLAIHGKAHEVGSAFFYGREDIIPDMFTVLIDELEANQAHTTWLRYYLQRHIDLDGDEHGPLAEKLLVYLCEGQKERIAEVEHMAYKAIEARIQLWNGVVAEIEVYEQSAVTN